MRIKPDIRIELNIALFGALLNFAWEVQQMPLFDLPVPVDLQAAIAGCTRATFGDALILLAAYWLVALATRSRRWLFSPTVRNVTAYILIGLAATVLIEALSTGVLGRWQYGEAMPVLPVLGTALSPVLQWMLLPPLVLWLARRQLAGACVDKGK